MSRIDVLGCALEEDASEVVAYTAVRFQHVCAHSYTAYDTAVRCWYRVFVSVWSAAPCGREWYIRAAVSFVYESMYGGLCNCMQQEHRRNGSGV